jgi:hypothetical protein
VKKLTIITTLLISTSIFSSLSLAEWTRVSETVKRNSMYIDFERIRKEDGYVYFWLLKDLFKPNKYGSLSVLDYDKADCKLFRYKNIVQHQKSGSMGNGTGKIFDTEDINWSYPTPNSSIETILKVICSH